MSAGSFRGFELVTREAGGEPVKADEVDDRPSLGKLASLGAQASVLFLANPDNPSGTLHPRDQLLELIAAVPHSVTVVVDEAYMEYAAPDGGQSLLHDVDVHPNLLVLRSFSKAYGLAGARVGWLYAHQDWPARALLQAIPHRLSGQAIAAGLAALEDQVFMTDCVERNRIERGRLREGLAGLGLHSLRSVANFLAVDARALAGAAERLHDEGVEVRDLALYGKPGWLRITVGTREENATLLASLARICGSLCP